jgi:hypothetical protein
MATKILRIRGILKCEQGSAIIILAVAMTVMVGMAALVADIGVNYVNQNQLMVAADAAALAGGTQLKTSREAATQAALDIVQKNGISTDMVTVEVDEDLTGITVKTRALIRFFFARLFATEEGMMEQRARVAKTRPIAFHNVFPLGVDESVKLDYSKEVNLFSKELLGGGNWGALTFKDANGNYMTGASIFREFLKNGYSGLIEIGDVVMCKGGVNMGPISEGIEYRFQQCAEDHGEHGPEICPSDCPRILILPIYTISNVKDEVIIIDFAVFYVTKLLGSGSNTEVWGHFQKLHLRAAASVEGESEYGLTTIKLIE